MPTRNELRKKAGQGALPATRPMPLSSTEVGFGRVPDQVFTAGATEQGGGGSAFLFEGTGVPADQMGFQGDPHGLSHLESFVPEGQIGPEGEFVMPGKIQSLIDNPELAQVDADLARLQAQDPELLDADELKEYKAAEKRIEDYAFSVPDKPTTLPAVPTMADVQRFEENLIQEKFGGVDPRTRNIYAEIQALGPERYRSAYEQSWDPLSELPALYDDLDAKTRSEFEKQVRTAEFQRVQEEIQLQTEALNRVINQATAEVKKTEKAEADRKKAVAKMKAAGLKTREQAQERAVELSGKLSDARTELAEKELTGDPESIAAHKEYIQQLTIALKEATRKATETEQAGAPKRTGEEGGTLKPATAEIVQQAKEKFPGDLAAALQWLKDQGYNTAPGTGVKPAAAKSPAETGNELFSEAAGAA